MKTSLTKYPDLLIIGSIAVQLMLSPIVVAQDESSSDARINLSFIEIDSVKEVKAVVTKDSSGLEIPVAGVELQLFIKKSFGLLPVGDALTTDENGEATAEFPKDLPGDSVGNVLVVGKVEDHEELGSFELEKPVQWGIPKTFEHSLNERALWASGANAPLPLVFFVTSMVALVWGIIGYIIVLLFKIPKL